MTLNFVNSDLRQKVDQLMDELWAGGVNNPMTAIEQISYLMFLKSLTEMDEKQEQLQNSLEMALPDSNPLGEARDISDATEVIQWYQYFIYVKLMRALHGLFRRDEDDIEMYDANGSAKVALESIDRSISAWGRLLERFDEQEDKLLSILVDLQRLRTITENTFPDARSFIRPGLDE